jgi:hypothetical protein
MDLQIIQNKIYEIRSQRVMLDFDLAELYGTETKRLKEAVRRNMERFEGEDFMFQLTKNEIEILSRTQIATLNKTRGYNIKYPPFAFSELGVAMLSSVLNSKTAIEINRGIMRIFVTIRQSLVANPNTDLAQLQAEMKQLKDYIEEVFTDYNDMNEDTRMQIELINQSLVELHIDKKQNSKPKNKIGYLTYENDDE